MYYHNSPTVKQLKALKTARATEMKTHLHNMTQTTSKYDNAIYLLNRLRTKELDIENDMSTGRLGSEKLVKERKKIEHIRYEVTKIVNELLGFELKL